PPVGWVAVRGGVAARRRRARAPRPARGSDRGAAGRVGVRPGSDPDPGGDWGQTPTLAATGVRPRPWRRLGSDPDLGGDWGQTPTLAATGVRPRPWRRLGSDPDVAGDWGQTPTLRATGVRPRPLGRPGSDPAADGGADLLDDAIDRAPGCVHCEIRRRIQRLPRREQRAQVRHRLRMIGHRPAIPLADHPVPMILR